MRSTMVRQKQSRVVLVELIVFGGQTDADRAPLDFAQVNSHGGRSPTGRCDADDLVT